jgi:septum formation protein
MSQLILASSSQPRQLLLQRLGVPFTCHPPHIDETPHPGESLPQLVERLSIAKAKAVAQHYPNAVIIGSDQAAVIEGETDFLGKPGDYDTAVAQLRRMSGRTVTFLAGLCVWNATHGTWQYHGEPTLVRFRELSLEENDSYLQRDQPYACCGSFKSESLGIALTIDIQSRDPSALIGLPLIALCKMLRQQNVAVL